MLDIARCKPVVASILLGGLAFAAPPVIAHPPHSPYDDSVFAPIKRFGPRVAVEVLASGLVAPLKGVTAPGDADHLYVVDQTGQAWKVNIHTKERTLFFDVASRLVTLGVLGDNSFDERGFLGLAFHPGYAHNRLLYTYTSEASGGGTPTFPTTLPAGVAADHQNVVAEWRVTANGIANRRELMRVDWPQFNHDGGDLAFGPDGLLYISMGDGGGADDKDGQLFIRGDRSGLEAPIVGHGPDGNGQKLTNPLGKILRIDVDGRNSANGQYGIPKDNPFRGMGGGRLAEIYAYGFRNPYRFSFDRLKGTLFVGDVGQNDIEEVDVVRKGGNYGWPVKEGTLFFNPRDNDVGVAQRTPVRPVPPNLIDPVAQYDTHHEGHSVVAGYVYRGRALHGLYGRFIFGEFSTIFNFPTGPHDYGRLLHISGHDGGKGLRAISEFHIVGGNSLGFAVLGMGEDAEGEVYLTGNRSGLPFGNAGMVLKIVPAPNERHDQDDED
jgi:glucose/arabinose dehydrogenase